MSSTDHEAGFFVITMSTIVICAQADKTYNKYDFLNGGEALAADFSDSSSSSMHRQYTTQSPLSY